MPFRAQGKTIRDPLGREITFHTGDNIRCYEIAGVSVRLDAGLPFSDRSFDPKFTKFRTSRAGNDSVRLHLRFSLPDIRKQDLGREVYRKPPWAIYRRRDSWLYLGISPDPSDPTLHKIAIFNDGHTRGRVYDSAKELFCAGGLHSLTLFPTDQIVLARVLADRQACYLHAAGMIIDGKGFLFIGHSDAGKSTTVTMLREEGEILCDDRIIVRRWPDGFRIHGTWSHGDIPDVSPNSAPLRAILFLEKADENRLLPIDDPKELVRMLPFFVVKPLVTADWWEKTLDLVGRIAREVPAYRMRFDRSGRIVQQLKELAS